LVITSSSLAGGTVGYSYAQTLQVSGGTAPYSWSITSGRLPAGLSLTQSTGVISGLATTVGTSTFTATVTDSSSPAQVTSVTPSLVVAPAALSIVSTTLANSTLGTAYAQTLQAAGGTSPYTWSIGSGQLPLGLSLSSSGIISGIPLLSSSSNFAVTVTDSGTPIQTQSASLTIAATTPTTSPLSILSSVLSNGTAGSSYSQTLQASGGTPGYTWSIASGSLPAGLTMAATTGVISGTPSAAGASTFTAALSDNSSPVQTQSVATSITVAAAQTAGPGTTWYVRADGGTRYSVNVPGGQCDGQGDLPYPGSGTNQHCAFNDVRFLWTDGTYTVDSSAGSPKWGWIGSGGDTYLIRGGPWRIGQNGPNSSDWFGMAGNPQGAGAPPPLSGTASAPTRILGENYASCSAQAAETQLFGGFGVGLVLNMNGSSYVDVQCLDISDHSSCGRQGQLNSCSTSYPLSDYASNGIGWYSTSTHDTLTHVRIHGLASAGMIGPTGTGAVFTYLDLVGNASSGWNADPGDGTTGTGTLLVQHFNISFNGCAEEYPLVDPLPYADCTDDLSHLGPTAGYGDGFGTATVISSPAWNVVFDQGVVTYNTQDGLDALHIHGVGSSMTASRVLAYGNEGQQLKIGGAQGTVVNDVMVGNCNAMRFPIPGLPAGYNNNLGDFCRAADTAVALTVGKGSILTYDNNTLYAANATGIEIDCDPTAGNCDASSLVDFRNNIFLAFQNNTATGYPNGGSTSWSNPVYIGIVPYVNPFLNAGSISSHNATYNQTGSWACPNTGTGELNAVCGDPGLTDETWHLYGYGNMAPASSSSAVVGAGVTLPIATTDYTGQVRSNLPTIGAYEQ
jgi:hypothetical protein